MIGKNYKYKGFLFSDDTANANRIVLEDVKKTISLNTTVFNKQNYHGSVATNTLATGRLFTFVGKIFGVNREDRALGQKRLNDIIKPEGLFNNPSEGFYELSFTQDDGSEVKCNARVYSMPDYNTSVEQNYIINFTFDLYVENPYFISFEDKEINQNVSTIPGGNNLPNLLPNLLNGFSIVTFSEANISDIDGFDLIDVELNEISTLEQNPAGTFPNAENLGNFDGPCRIQVIGELENPTITNLSNGRFYGLSGITTNDLVIDNKTNNFIVTDEGVNVKSFRIPGSKQIFLSPGVNEILVNADNLSLEDSYNIIINYNDYYINN